MTPGMIIAYYLIPPKQRKGKPYAKFIIEKEAFTATTIEPAIVFILALFSSGIVITLWLFLSSFAMAVHTYWREMARKNKSLDFQDGKIAAELMRELRNPTAPDKIKPVATPERPYPQPVAHIIVRYPDVMSIVEAINREKNNRSA